MFPDPLGLASTVVNADMDAREVEPSGVDTHKRGVLPVVGTAPVMAEGTAGVEPAGGAEKATAAKPEALEPGAYDEDCSRRGGPPQGDRRERATEREAPTRWGPQREGLVRTRKESD